MQQTIPIKPDVKGFYESQTKLARLRTELGDTA
jgi:hypothetical protein